MDAKTRDLLAKRREPAIWFRSVEKAVSGSRWGGCPSLPDGVAWPVHPDTKRPLHFIAQVDLSAVPATPMPGCPFKAKLPPTGMLFFFFDFAEYWNDKDIVGAPKHSRVIYAAVAGADREAPETLPNIGYDPDAPDGEGANGEKLLPMAHLQAHAIDTFWNPQFSIDGKWTRYIERDRGREFGPDDEATWDSMVSATGEAAPVFEANAIPSPPPGCYFVKYETDSGARLRRDTTKFQMFGPETQVSYGSGDPPRDTSMILLLELPIDAHEIGSLQYWMRKKDFEAWHFERACANAHFS